MDEKMIMEANNILGCIYGLVSQIDNEIEFMMFLGVLVDAWSADHGLTAEESKNMVAGLILVHGLVNDEFGVMK